MVFRTLVLLAALAYVNALDISAAVAAAVAGVETASEPSEIVKTWPNAELWYEWQRPEAFNEYERSIIESALWEVKNLTKVKMLYRTNSTRNFVQLVMTAYGFQSELGYQEGLSRFYIDRNWLKAPGGRALVLRHLMRILGFSNEEVRSDRDQYLRIDNDNISSFGRRELRKVSGRNSHIFNQPYDFHSIMHSTANAYSVDRDLPSLFAMPPYQNCTLGGRSQLSAIDVARINALYFPKDPNPILPAPCAPLVVNATRAAHRVGEFRVRIRLIQYSNPDSVDYQGQKCDPAAFPPSWKRCDPEFWLTYAVAGSSNTWNIPARQDVDVIEFGESDYRDVSAAVGASIRVTGHAMDEDWNANDVIGRIDVSHTVSGVTTNTVTTQINPQATMTIRFEVVQH